jgi:hypothetical protein
MSESRAGLSALAVLWPSFLMAGVLEVVVFALVDPTQLHWFGGAPVELPASAVYTLAFFVFWVVIAAAGAMTRFLDLSPSALNAPPDRSSSLSNSRH